MLLLVGVLMLLLVGATSIIALEVPHGADEGSYGARRLRLLASIRTSHPQRLQQGFTEARQLSELRSTIKRVRQPAA